MSSSSSSFVFCLLHLHFIFFCIHPMNFRVDNTQTIRQPHSVMLHDSCKKEKQGIPVRETKRASYRGRKCDKKRIISSSFSQRREKRSKKDEKIGKGEDRKHSMSKKDIPKTGKSDERREISLAENTSFDESLLIPLCSSLLSFT